MERLPSRPRKLFAGNEAFLLSLYGMTAALALAIGYDSPGTFTTVAVVVCGGKLGENMVERYRGRQYPPEDAP